MNVFNHIIVEEQIIGISPIKLEKGIWKDRLYFDVYTKGGMIPVHSEYFESHTPQGINVVNRFQVEYDAALAAVRNVTREETKVYSLHANEVSDVYQSVCNSLAELSEMVEALSNHSPKPVQESIVGILNKIDSLRKLALK
jgi:hypothetical protein